MGKKTKGQGKKKQAPNPTGREGKPVTLAPLDFKEAVAGILSVRATPKKQDRSHIKEDRHGK